MTDPNINALESDDVLAQGVLEQSPPSTIDVAQLVQRCQDGQLEEFGQLYDMYVKKIYDFIYYKTHHKETAEDLCSKTFMKAMEHISKFDTAKGSFSSWIYRIAQNNVIDHYRTKKIEYDIDDAWDLKSKDNIMQDLENKEKFAAVEKYLATLKVEQRDIVMLRVWNGMSYKEISEIIGKSEDNCKMIFSRVMTKLRKDMLLMFFLIFFNR